MMFVLIVEMIILVLCLRWWWWLSLYYRLGGFKPSERYQASQPNIPSTVGQTITLHRVIPTLDPHPDISFWHSFGHSVYLTYVLTFFLVMVMMMMVMMVMWWWWWWWWWLWLLLSLFVILTIVLHIIATPSSPFASRFKAVASFCSSQLGIT